MSAQVPQLFDPVKLAMLEQRAMRAGCERFLLDRTCDDLEDRLATLIKPFTRVLDFGTPFGAFADRVRTLPHFASAQIIGATGAEAMETALKGPDRYDLIVSGMLFQRVNDLPGLLLRLKALLVPDGLVLAAFPGGDTLHELRDVLMRAESEIRGSAALRVYPNIEVRTAGSLLQRAGFALPVTDADKLTIRYANFFTLLRDLRAMGASAAALVRPGVPMLSRAILTRAAELYHETYADADGRIRARFDMLWMSGWAAHESQQKPLAPGSAKMRLADALRVPSEKKS